jgi:hypothetical protein
MRQIGFISLMCVLCFGSKIRAQYNTEFLNHSNTGRSISANFEFDAGSSGFTNSLVNKLLWGGYIDNALKTDASKHLVAKNNLGINLNYGLSAFIKGNNKFDFLIAVKDEETLNATYSKDLFNLVFYGNAMYAGKTANLANCNANLVHFQEVKFGAIGHVFDSVTKIGASVSFLKGQQLFSAATNKSSSLYTSSDGSEIFLNSNFNMALSNPNKNNLANLNGAGASIDLYFERQYKSIAGKKGVLIVNASNIGFIRWQNNTQYSSDSTFRYTGYHVNNILSFSDSSLNSINKDSLLHTLANSKKKSPVTKIPANLLIVNKLYFGQELFSLSVGFRYIFYANYKPYVFLEPEYRYKHIIFGLHTGYGGYARLNVGASVAWNCKSVFLKIGSNGLQGYILPKIAYGQGLFFSLAKKFR